MANYTVVLRDPSEPALHFGAITDGEYLKRSGNTIVSGTPAGGGGGRLPQTVALGAYLVLTNVGASYDAIAATNGLGIATVDFSGVTTIDFRVRCNKIGTGHQYWQLWNESDSTHIFDIRDAGSAGTKLLSATTTGRIPTGVKVVRVRSMSSVAADDPVYMGASILVY